MNILALNGVDVFFGGLHALDNVSMLIEEGEIHGLIGPNGAGKTTLINVMSGLIRPASGDIELRGGAFPTRTNMVRAAGIVRTFQTPVVFQELTALENVMLGGIASTSSGLAASIVGTRQSRNEERSAVIQAQESLDRVGFDGDPAARASTLSFGNERKVEVARALMCDPSLLLLDEPTAGFTRVEVEQFAELLKTIRERAGVGLTILVVEHNVPFIFGLCDRVTALDQGRVIGRGAPSDVRRNEAVIQSYLGAESKSEDVKVLVPRVRSEADTGGVDRGQGKGLRIERLTAGYGGVTAIRGVDLSVDDGEIVAVLGRNGAGKSTLFNALMKTVRSSSGRISWRGDRIDGLSTEAIVARGIGLVPQGRGVMERQTVADNLRLAVFGLRLTRGEVHKRMAAIYEMFPRLVDRQRELAGRLSGGERQMLAIGKVLMRQPSLLVLDEPSIGLAVGIVHELQGVIARINSEGTAVLIAEQNVGWVVPLAHRGYVLDSGNVVQEGSMAKLTESGALTEQFLGT